MARKQKKKSQKIEPVELAPRKPRALPWDERWDGWIVVAAALVVRVVYLLNLRANDPFYDYTLRGFDQHTYQRMAEEIVGGDLLLRGRGLFYYGPLYAYFSALIFWIGGLGNYDLLHAVQLFIAVGTCGLMWSLARTYVDRVPAFLAGSMAAFCSAWLFYEQLLLMEGLVLFLQLAMLYLLRTAEIGRRFVPLRLGGAGMASALAFFGRGNIAMFVAAVPFWILWRMREKEGRAGWIQGAARAGVFAGAAGVLLIGMGIRSYAVKEEFAIGTTNGPAMLYLGNAADASGEFAYSPRFQEAHAKSQSDPEIYSKQLREDLGAAPGAIAFNMLRKFYFFWNAYDLPDNTSFYLGRQFSPLTRWNPIGFHMIVVIGLIGAGLIAREWRSMSLLWLYLILFSISVIIVVPIGRYKLPITIPLMIFAGYALDWMWTALDEKRFARLSAVAAAALVLIVVTNPFKSPRVRPNDYNAFTTAAIERGKFARVESFIAGYARDYPQAADPHLLNFVYLVEKEDWAKARAELQRLLQAQARLTANASLAAAKLYLHEGNREQARQILQMIVDARPEMTEAKELLDSIAPAAE